ncbi:MAG TPA: rRNA maturation factor, partial [Firmicutes bacterium]|nr:rRNA maturation factor [Bacillota bacterium]
MILMQNDQVEVACSEALLSFCEQVLTRTLGILQLPAEAEVSVMLVNNEAIQALNLEYRG